MRRRASGEVKMVRDAQLRRGEFLLWLPWAVGTLMLAIHVVGAKLFLVYLYGWARVRDEHLRILSMPKGDPWPVSNGQVIAEGQGVHFFISLVCWFVMFFATYPLVRLVLPRARPAGGDGA